LVSGTPLLSSARIKSLKLRSSGGNGWSRRLRDEESKRFFRATVAGAYGGLQTPKSTHNGSSVGWKRL
jgi:hypothetical protein